MCCICASVSSDFTALYKSYFIIVIITITSLLLLLLLLLKCDADICCGIGAATDADRHFCDQNVMCMRSGLVIKTAPISRSSLSSRLQSECQTRGPRDLASISAVSGTRPQQPQLASSPAPQQPAAEASGADSAEVTAAPSGGSAKTGAWRSSGATRPRSLDFLSIVTRFQLARRARAVQLGIDTADGSHYDDWINNAVELDFIPDDNPRSL